MVGWRIETSVDESISFVTTSCFSRRTVCRPRGIRAGDSGETAGPGSTEFVSIWQEERRNVIAEVKGGLWIPNGRH